MPVVRTCESKYMPVFIRLFRSTVALSFLLPFVILNLATTFDGGTVCSFQDVPCPVNLPDCSKLPTGWLTLLCRLAVIRKRTRCYATIIAPIMTSSARRMGSSSAARKWRKQTTNKSSEASQRASKRTCQKPIQTDVVRQNVKWKINTLPAKNDVETTV